MGSGLVNQPHDNWLELEIYKPKIFESATEQNNWCGSVNCKFKFVKHLPKLSAAYSLGAYSLGAYSLARPILQLASAQP